MLEKKYSALHLLGIQSPPSRLYSSKTGMNSFTAWKQCSVKYFNNPHWLLSLPGEKTRQRKVCPVKTLCIDSPFISLTQTHISTHIATHKHYNIFRRSKVGSKYPHLLPPCLPYHFTGRPGRCRSPRFVVCLCRADWAARDWRPAGVLSNQRSAPRPMGESSLLLAEASVGKNAERVSHELGAREPGISSAAACVSDRSGKWLWAAHRTHRTHKTVQW